MRILDYWFLIHGKKIHDYHLVFPTSIPSSLPALNALNVLHTITTMPLTVTTTPLPFLDHPQPLSPLNSPRLGFRFSVLCFEFWNFWNCYISSLDFNAECINIDIITLLRSLMLFSIYLIVCCSPSLLPKINSKSKLLGQ